MGQADSADSSSIKQLQQVWETHARQDPLWAIVSRNDKKDGKWDLNEFLATGEQEIETLVETLSSHQIKFDRRSALDFGCGVGRLTQALAHRFESVHGVDISPTMIKTATELNQYPATCLYLVNAEDNLQAFRDDQFTFIYSNLVLQHMEPRISREYIVEFGRVAKPGALVVFQLPSLRRPEDGLPAAACVASIICSPPTGSWRAGIREKIHARVENVSRMAWLFDKRRPLLLANHWLGPEGEMIRRDDGRAVLPNDIQPGQGVDLVLVVNTPPVAGAYILELDLVQDGVAWFKQRGSRTSRTSIEILAPPDSAMTTTPESNADHSPSGFQGFKMHCTPRSEVIDLLQACGLRLEFIQESKSAGPGFQSYFYFARKLG